MKRYRWILLAGFCLLAGLVMLAIGWNGQANVTLSSSISAAAVNFCGAAHGWSAVLGVLALLLGIIFLVVAIISAATGLARGEGSTPNV
jgi:hypothetical protein